MSTESEYDVSLSHNLKDRAVVRPLAEELQQNGLKVSFDGSGELVVASDLIEAIGQGVAPLKWVTACFAYADDYDRQAKRYRALRCAQQVVVTEDRQTALRVKPEAAQSQVDAEKPAPPAGQSSQPPALPAQPGEAGKGEGPGPVIEQKPPGPLKPERFFGYRRTEPPASR